MNKHLDGFTGIRATYRLQFRRHFTFRDATGLVPYLATLGTSHIYASPIIKARRGSSHGYDIIGPDARFRAEPYGRGWK